MASMIDDNDRGWDRGTVTLGGVKMWDTNFNYKDAVRLDAKHLKTVLEEDRAIGLIVMHREAKTKIFLLKLEFRGENLDQARAVLVRNYPDRPIERGSWAHMPS